MPAPFHASITSSHLDLSSLRHEVRAWLDGCPDSGQPPSIDIDVVVTELVANAIDHTDAPTVELDIVIDGPRVRVAVANDNGADEPVLTSEWAEAGERGRGLRLVAALSDDLRLLSESGRSVVVAELVGERQPVCES
ncbi:MAG: ATP-binding protein [Actinomycetota bacterium]